MYHCWYYPRVDLAPKWSILVTTSTFKGGFRSKLGKVATLRGWIWPKIGQGGHYRPCWHYPKVDLGPKWSILVTNMGPKDPKVANPCNCRRFPGVQGFQGVQGWVWAPRSAKLPKLPKLKHGLQVAAVAQVGRQWREPYRNIYIDPPSR